jgi:aryl carrier-like protein
MAVMEINDTLRMELFRIKSETAKHLPEYMVPTLFVPLINMPMNTSGKIDRKKLREKATKFDQKQVALYSLSHTAQAAQGKDNAINTTTTSCSPIELALAALWAETLSIELEKDPIGSDDSFLELGGDSITAMQLVGKARASGLALSVPRIMRSPKLRDMALAAMRVDGVQIKIPEVPRAAELAVPEPPLTPPGLGSPDLTFESHSTVQVTPPPENPFEMAYSPFQLVARKVSKSDIMAVLADKYNIGPGMVLDVYPATALQGAYNFASEFVEQVR